MLGSCHGTVPTSLRRGAGRGSPKPQPCALPYSELPVALPNAAGLSYPRPSQVPCGGAAQLRAAQGGGKPPSSAFLPLAGVGWGGVGWGGEGREGRDEPRLRKDHPGERKRRLLSEIGLVLSNTRVRERQRYFARRVSSNSADKY